VENNQSQKQSPIDLFSEIKDEKPKYSGFIKNIIYYNPSNNFTIANFETENETIIIKGTIINPVKGLPIEIAGEWTESYNFGNQFKVEKYRLIEPVSEEGIIKYLSSGLIKDIGLKFAEKIVAKFGQDTFNVLKNNPEKLLEISGIGEKKLNSVKTFFKEHFIINDIFYFLITKNISPTYAYKIYEAFKEESINIIKTNPYKLIEIIDGIGFKKADSIAKEIGIAADAPFRIQSAIYYILDTAANQDGHSYLPIDELLLKLSELLELPIEEIKNKLNDEILQEKIKIEDDRVYLIWNYVYEKYIAEKLLILKNSNFIEIINPEKTISETEEEIGIKLSEEQYKAIIKALNTKLFVLTGGPGTGKTTIIKFITNVFLRNRLTVSLCCPTGRAAKRLSEATGLPATTIHRLLEYSIQNGFQRNEAKPLDCDILIIDEMSMVDLKIFFHLLKAINKYTRIIMVGDVNQLPSVGAGNLLKDIINSNISEVYRLTKIFRQAENSLIILNSHKINNGEQIIIKNQDKNSNFFFIEKETPEEIQNEILSLFFQRIPENLKISSDDIQILIPIYKSIIGVDTINLIIQEQYNKNEKALILGNKKFKIDDRVMQLKNNYNKNVMNGDIGKVISFGNNFDEFVDNAIDKKLVKEWYRNLDTKIKERENLLLVVKYDDLITTYTPAELDEITLAYAISIHKSQGSEFKAVIIPIHTIYYVMLVRNLLYTAVTRGKELVILIGSKKALYMAIKNDKEKSRYSSLLQRLTEQKNKICLL